MAPETTTSDWTFRTDPSEGLHQIVLKAAKLTQGERMEASGILEIVPVQQDPSCVLAIEAEVADDGLRRAISKLEVRVLHLTQSTPRALLERALRSFGGLEFTSLAFAEPGAHLTDEETPATGLHAATEEDAIDLTVQVPSKHFPFFAKNMTLSLPRLTTKERDVGALALGKLGVSHRKAAESLRVAPFQLRRKMTLEAQASAFLALAEAGMRVSIYAAALPPVQSIRVAEQPAQPGTPAANPTTRRLEIDLSRGLSGGEITTSEEAFQMEQFLKEELGIAFGDREWRLRGNHWEMPPEKRPVVPR